MTQFASIHLRVVAGLAAVFVASSALAAPARRVRPRPARPRVVPVAGIAPRLLGVCGQPVAGSLAFSSDGKHLVVGSGRMASGTSPGEVRVWDVASGLVMYTLPYTSPVNAVAYAPVGDTLAASTVQSRVLVWSAAAGASLRTLAPPRTTGGLCLAFAPKGGVLATGGGDLAGGQFPGEARLWDVKSGRLLRTLPHPHRSVVSLQFVPGSGDCLVASRGLGADSQGSLDLWDKSLKTRRWTRAAPDLIGAALVAGGASVASVQSEVVGKQYLLRVRLWNGKNGTAQSGYRAPMGGWAISPSGGLLACSGVDRKSVAVRDVRTGRLLHRLECSYPPASLSFAFSTDSRMLAAGTQDGSVLLWTLK